MKSSTDFFILSVVSVKGKGDMKTFWLSVSSHRGNSNSISDRTASTASVNMDDEHKEEHADVPSNGLLDAKTKRLVQWNVEILLRQLKQIVAHREARSTLSSEEDAPIEDRYSEGKIACCLDEVKEIITLPGFLDVKQDIDAESVQIDDSVIKQLYSYMSRIAVLYRNNPFHNFEHASHVTMSVGKLLSRIVAPQNLSDNTCDASFLHDHTYGITSDPLTQFSCILSALIHDVDHPGVPNAQLVQEDCQLAKQYKNKSPAEQNSVDLAWNLLMEEEYKDLRGVIYQTDAELIRFRQLIVNSVMATDIADRELKVLRNHRWDRAFSKATTDANKHDTVNRKATIVIEHLIQASDVAHTMQHWHVYRKWNERFFLECYEAYKNGRAEKNPADGWYEGEIGFFDYYIIPLAKKLKDCGVFGVSSDEYLNYALRNRQEWESRGQEIISEMMETVSADVANGIQSTQTAVSSLPITSIKFMNDIDPKCSVKNLVHSLPNPPRTCKAA
jgi:3'5'-cyclic nucleotide phosphodiesterase